MTWERIRPRAVQFNPALDWIYPLPFGSAEAGFLACLRFGRVRVAAVPDSRDDIAIRQDDDNPHCDWLLRHAHFGYHGLELQRAGGVRRLQWTLFRAYEAAWLAAVNRMREAARAGGVPLFLARFGVAAIGDTVSFEREIVIYSALIQEALQNGK